MRFFPRPLTLGLCSLAFTAMAVSVPAISAAPAKTDAAAPAALSSLVAAVNIPYEQFTLKNGLRVIVHTDRKAPVVAVSVWYHVGSRFEPSGKTGFAHLFEHLMFYGSENADGPFFGRLEDIGDRLERDDLVRPHQLFRNGPDRCARPRAVS